MRINPENGAYRDCRWCQGAGCMSCQIEADKEYKRQFPNGPQPIATFSMEDLASGKLKGLLSPEAIDSVASEARTKATEKVASLGGWRQLLNCADEEAVDALTPSLMSDILVERIRAAGGSV